jgi:hypothetical protein
LYIYILYIVYTETVRLSRQAAYSEVQCVYSVSYMCKQTRTGKNKSQRSLEMRETTSESYLYVLPLTQYYSTVEPYLAALKAGRLGGEGGGGGHSNVS